MQPEFTSPDSLIVASALRRLPGGTAVLFGWTAVSLGVRWFARTAFGRESAIPQFRTGRPPERRVRIRAVEPGEPDWTRLRSFADQITLHPEWTAAAITDAPSPGSLFMSNLLAAIAEKLADEAKIQRPGWAKQIPALESPWEAPATPRRRAMNAENTPAQFAARRITLPERTIWRERELIPT